MDINKEMEMMLADHEGRDYSPMSQPFKKKAKKRDMRTAEPLLSNMILPESMLLN